MRLRSLALVLSADDDVVDADGSLLSISLGPTAHLSAQVLGSRAPFYIFLHLSSALDALSLILRRRRRNCFEIRVYIWFFRQLGQSAEWNWNESATHFPHFPHCLPSSERRGQSGIANGKWETKQRRTEKLRNWKTEKLKNHNTTQRKPNTQFFKNSTRISMKVCLPLPAGWAKVYKRNTNTKITRQKLTFGEQRKSTNYTLLSEVSERTSEGRNLKSHLNTAKTNQNKEKKLCV